MYVDPIKRHPFNYANQIPCENSPQIVIALDPDTGQYYVLIHNLLKQTLFYCLNQLNFELLLAQTPLLPKMQAFTLF